MTDIIVKDIRIHGTGYLEVDVVAVQKLDSSTRVGPMHTYGICPHEIKAKYNGKLETWLQAVKGIHEVHSGFHDDLADQLKGWKGKTL